MDTKTQYVIKDVLPYAPAVPGTDMGEQRGGDIYWKVGQAWTYTLGDATRFSEDRGTAEHERLHRGSCPKAELVDVLSCWRQFVADVKA